MNAVVLLTRGYKNKEKYEDLINRNKSLEQFYNNNISYLVFHEGNINEDHQNYIQSNTIIPLKFVNVKDSFKKKTMSFTTKTAKYGIGYRNMCNFWICDFWKYVEEYDKILRIDEDCIYESDYNKVFDILDNNKVCVYGGWEKDQIYCCMGMNKFIVDFLNNNGINAKKKNDNIQLEGPYTNVIGFNLILLRNNDILQKYLIELKKINKIYTHRWGDLSLWGEILDYMYEEDDHIHSENIVYYHGSHGRQIKEGKIIKIK